MAVKDFIVDSNGEMLIANGDFVVGESDQQHIEHILITYKGEWKQNPFVGIGLRSYLKAPKASTVVDQLTKNIRIQMKLDGFQLKTLKMEGLESIKIDAERNEG